ncbi:hypothetical protein ACIP01_11205 [Pseudomonas monteilii]|uniref:hypothetical protein n=1 Tax=Pseudomonas monteilii TaxID=76759 RepID=UPI00380D3620
MAIIRNGQSFTKDKFLRSIFGSSATVISQAFGVVFREVLLGVFDDELIHVDYVAADLVIRVTAECDQGL